MSDEELKSWRTLVNVLYEYGLGDLFRTEINDVANCLRRLKNDRKRT